MLTNLAILGASHCGDDLGIVLYWVHRIKETIFAGFGLQQGIQTSQAESMALPPEGEHRQYIRVHIFTRNAWALPRHCSVEVSHSQSNVDATSQNSYGKNNKGTREYQTPTPVKP